MYLSKIVIENFRGIKHLDLEFSPEINIIIGENNCCKSALIDAIRLLYNLGEQARDIYIGANDFFEEINYNEDGSYVINKANQIKISYEFKDLSHRQKGAFYEYLIIDNNDEKKDTANITLEYDDIGNEHPKFIVTSGAAEGQRPDYNTFNLFQHYYLSALRDSTRDLTSVRNNLLGKVIRRNVERNKSENIIKDIIKEANSKLLARDEVQKTRNGVNENLREIFKEIIENQIGLQIEQSKIEHIVNVIKPYLPYDILKNSNDGFQLIQNSLGYNNLIYIATVLGDIKERIKEDDIPHYSLLIEEPEAHLHPQLQLSLYNFLKQANSNVNSQLFLTTHSPTLTSKVPFDSIILLDEIGHRVSNCFFERAKENLIFNTTKGEPITNDYVLVRKKMLERYLDVTKSQLFYARGCLFVEGISEGLLIKTFCKILGFELEDYRIELVNVEGTSFYPFLFLFNSSNINKRLLKKAVILTDDDRFTDSSKSSFEDLSNNNFESLNDFNEKQKSGTPVSRIANLVSAKNNQENIVIKTAYKTLEYEICRSNIFPIKEEIANNFLFNYIETIDKPKIDLIKSYYTTLAEPISENEQSKIAILLWKSLPTKAEFAQDFSFHITNNIDQAKATFKIPQYIQDGLNFLK